jgi:hypothetical protein
MLQYYKGPVSISWGVPCQLFPPYSLHGILVYHPPWPRCGCRSCVFTWPHAGCGSQVPASLGFLLFLKPAKPLPMGPLCSFVFCLECSDLRFPISVLWWEQPSCPRVAVAACPSPCFPVTTRSQQVPSSRWPHDDSVCLCQVSFHWIERRRGVRRRNGEVLWCSS